MTEQELMDYDVLKGIFAIILILGVMFFPVIVWLISVSTEPIKLIKQPRKGLTASDILFLSRRCFMRMQTHRLQIGVDRHYYRLMCVRVRLMQMLESHDIVTVDGISWVDLLREARYKMKLHIQ